MPTKRRRITGFADHEGLAVCGYDLSRSNRDTAAMAVIGPTRRLAAILDRAARAVELDRGEWNAIADANNGAMDLEDYRDGPRLSPAVVLSANVEDKNDLEFKWGIDKTALAGKLRRLGPAEADAVAAAIRWFWRHSSDIDHNTQEWWTPAFRRAEAGRNSVPESNS